MKQFTVEFDEMACKWLEHIAEVTGQSIENIISNGVSEQVAKLEDMAANMFTYHE